MANALIEETPQCTDGDAQGVTFSVCANPVKEIVAGETVTLRGTAIVRNAGNGNEGQVKGFQWEQFGGPTVPLINVMNAGGKGSGAGDSLDNNRLVATMHST